jgi:RNA recognition motif-containing protein
MSANIYVGNIPYKMDESYLREIFEIYGKVSHVTIIEDHVTGISKGYGFIEMPVIKEAETAINRLNDNEVLGRRIQVRIANNM